MGKREGKQKLLRGWVTSGYQVGTGLYQVSVEFCCPASTKQVGVVVTV